MFKLCVVAVTMAAVSAMTTPIPAATGPTVNPMLAEIQDFGAQVAGLIAGIKQVRTLTESATPGDRASWEAVGEAAAGVIQTVELAAEEENADDFLEDLGEEPSPCKLCDVPGKAYFSDLILNFGMCLDGCTDICKLGLLNELDCFVESLEALLAYGQWAVQKFMLEGGDEAALRSLFVAEMDGMNRVAIQGLRFHQAGLAAKEAYETKRGLKSPLGDLDLRQLLVRTIKKMDAIKKRHFESNL